MRELIERILAAYGSGMTIVCADGEKAVRAFLQPVTEKSRETMRKTIGMLGEIPVGRFLYVGPAEPALPEDAEVRFRGERYRACRTETLVVADEALYVWGLLKKEGGDEPWTS